MKTRSLENTGTCPYCEANVKLGYQTKANKIGRHGFKVPRGYYQQIGYCPGFKKTPIEVGKDGLEDLIKMLELSKEQFPIAIEKLNSGETQTITSHNGKKTYTPNHPFWEMQKKQAIAALEQNIRALDRDIARLQAKLNNWQPQPLPGTAA